MQDRVELSVEEIEAEVPLSNFIIVVSHFPTKVRIREDASNGFDRLL